MAQSAYLSVSEDLDTIRRTVATDADLAPALTRFLAACSGTLQNLATTDDHTDDRRRRHDDTRDDRDGDDRDDRDEHGGDDRDHLPRPGGSR